MKIPGKNQNYNFLYLPLVSILASLTLLSAAGLPNRSSALTLTEIEFDNAGLQEKVAKKFPYAKDLFTKKNHVFLGTLILAHPEVRLEPGLDRIPVSVNFIFNPNPIVRVLHIKSLQGQTAGSAKLRYSRDTGEFFLDEPSMDDLDIEHFFSFGDKWLENYVNHKLPEWLNERPVYRMDSNIKSLLAAQVLQDVVVRKKSGKLVAKLGIGDPSPEAEDTASAPNNQDGKSEINSGDPGVTIHQWNKTQ